MRRVDMAGQIVDCTGRAFADLTNPYTGERMLVQMLVTKSGEPRFFAPRGYSTSQRFGTRDDAYAAWARSEGVDGARAGQPLVCAYTGKPLVLCHDETGWWFDGGFDPRMFYSRSEFLYFATMRDGVSKYEKPGLMSHVGITKERQKAPESHETRMLDGSLETAENVMHKVGFEPERKTQVSMSIPHKKKGKSR